jgi:hypothetical protein
MGLPPLAKLLVIFVILNALIIGGIASQQQIVFRNTAIVKSIDVGAYWDELCFNSIGANDGIDWGAIGPGENSTVVVYLRNEGNWRFTLSVRAANWSSPEAERYITFTTDYSGELIAVDGVIPVELALFISPDIRDVASFSFDIVIEADG